MEHPHSQGTTSDISCAEASMKRPNYRLRTGDRPATTSLPWRRSHVVPRARDGIREDDGASVRASDRTEDQELCTAMKIRHLVAFFSPSPRLRGHAIPEDGTPTVGEKSPLVSRHDRREFHREFAKRVLHTADEITGDANFSFFFFFIFVAY